MASASELEITYLGPKGDGVAQGRHGRVYIEGVFPGDVVRARTCRGDDEVIRGEITDVLEDSPYRREAPCAHYDQCGGCTLQHATTDFYRAWKQDVVHDALKKMNLNPKKWLAPVFVEGDSRRRATFATLRQRDRVLMGYYKRRSDHITDIKTCLVTENAIITMRDKLRPLLMPLIKEGRSADIFLQHVGGVFDMVFTGQIGKKGKPDLEVREALAELAHKAGIGRIGWRGRDRDSIEIMIETNVPTASFGDLRVPLPPAAFLQPTIAGEKALVDAVMGMLPAKGHFADLFSGCGTFAGPMLARGSVDAYESVDPAIKALMKAKGAKPLKAFRRDLFKNPLRRDEANRYDAIVFDPPRAGARDQCQALANGKVPLIVGVSCNPATFARDARILCDGNYRLDTVQVVDQFTWSHHVELVASFVRK